MQGTEITSVKRVGWFDEISVEKRLRVDHIFSLCARVYILKSLYLVKAIDL